MTMHEKHPEDPAKSVTGQENPRDYRPARGISGWITNANHGPKAM